MRYVARQGERWNLIAYKVFGNVNKLPELLHANDINPKLVMEGGEEIEIPELTEEEISKTPEAIVPWLSS